ncbi:MAG: deoxyribodipyrimidine photo-lyase [Flavobacteriales bacterium]
MKRGKGPPVTVHWFRRDLRLHDNHALLNALLSGNAVLPVFIFDTDILSDLQEKRDRRVDFIHRTLNAIKTQLQRRRSDLHVEVGTPIEAWQRIVERYDVKAVHANRDHEPYGIKRDAEIGTFLRTNGIAFTTNKDHSVFDHDGVVKEDGRPYTVYTPYKRKWRSLFTPGMMAAFKSEDHLAELLRTEPLPMPSLADIGFLPTDLEVPETLMDISHLRSYADTRNLPAVQGTSRLGIHLRFGTVSVRQVLRDAWELAPVFVDELIWREFFMQILLHFPQVITRAFKPAYDGIAWRNNPDEFAAWCEGRSGYPIVDAGMRELEATGFMHNRVRMLTASFLTKHLLIDWRWGEAWFASNLLDFELSSNNGNWQWASGSGCDAAPYFRIFSPAAQTERFDPEHAYIGRWVPEWSSGTYPKPIVDHDFARKRAMATYKAALVTDTGRSSGNPRLFEEA